MIKPIYEDFCNLLAKHENIPKDKDESMKLLFEYYNRGIKSENSRMKDNLIKAID